MDFRYTSRSVNDTLRIAQDLESEKFPNMVICLYGELGSGKTVFTKGFASAMEIDETITSPTFNIIKEYYSGELPLFHIDAYRVEDRADELGLEEYFHKGGIVIIEWADMIRDYLPEERLEIKIRAMDSDEDGRIITINPIGPKYEELCEAVL